MYLNSKYGVCICCMGKIETKCDSVSIHNLSNARGESHSSRKFEDSRLFAWLTEENQLDSGFIFMT